MQSTKTHLTLWKEPSRGSASLFVRWKSFRILKYDCLNSHKKISNKISFSKVTVDAIERFRCSFENCRYQTCPVWYWGTNTLFTKSTCLFLSLSVFCLSFSNCQSLRSLLFYNVWFLFMRDVIKVYFIVCQRCKYIEYWAEF